MARRKKKVERTPPAKSERPKSPVHVGHLVWRHLKNTGKKRQFLATESNRSLTTISRQLRRTTMQVAELYEFCEILKHNFFEQLAAKLPVEYSADVKENLNKQAAMEEMISQLLQANTELKEENKKLNERVDLLLKKL